MNINDDDLINNLRNMADGAAGSGPSADSQDRAWQTVLRRGKRTRHTRTAGAAAAAVVVAGAGLGVAGLGSAGQQPQSPRVMSAAYVLRSAAEHANSPQPKPGQYTHITRVRWRYTGVPVRARDTAPVEDGKFIRFRKKTREQAWIPPGAHGVMYRSETGPLATEFDSAADKRYATNHYPDRFQSSTRYFAGESRDGKRAAGPMHPIQPGRSAAATSERVSKGSPGNSTEDNQATWYHPTRAFLASLPTEPQALLDALATGHGESAVMLNDNRADTQFARLAQVLTSGLVQPDLRAALYEAALKIPGVTVTQDSTNLSGTPGIAVGRVGSTGHVRQEIVFSTDDYQYLGRRLTLVKPGGHTDLVLPGNLNAPKGTLLYSAAVTVDITDKPKFAVGQ